MSCEYTVATRVLGQLHPALARKTLELALAAAGGKLGYRVKMTPNDPTTVGFVGDHRVWISPDGSYGLEGSRRGDEIDPKLEETMAPLVEQAYVALGWKLALEAQGKQMELRAGENGTITVKEV